MKTISNIILIIAVSSIICGLSGIIKNDYKFWWPPFSCNLSDYTAILQSFLLATVSLVVSSTLFMGILLKDNRMPLMPDPNFVALLSEIRGNLRKINGSRIWVENIAIDKELKDSCENVLDKIAEVDIINGHKLAKKNLKPVRIGIESLKQAITEIDQCRTPEAAEDKWKKYFASSESLDNGLKISREEIESKYNSIQYIKGLKIG